MENLFHRISIRKYLNKPVEKEKILEILRAAMAAPSACNQRPWRFTVVTDREKIRELAAVSQYSVFAAAAPVILVISYRKDCLLPAEEEAFAMFSLGYPGEETRKHDRFQEEWIRWIE